MKKFGRKNHGKVFEVVGSVVTLWDPVNETIKWNTKNTKPFKISTRIRLIPDE